MVQKIFKANMQAGSLIVSNKEFLAHHQRAAAIFFRLSFQKYLLAPLKMIMLKVVAFLHSVQTINFDLTKKLVFSKFTSFAENGPQWELFQTFFFIETRFVKPLLDRRIDREHNKSSTARAV